MATFALTINTDNAAFEDGWQDEVIRILKEAAKVVALNSGFICGANLQDINGNTVGQLMHYPGEVKIVEVE